MIFKHVNAAPLIFSIMLLTLTGTGCNCGSSNGSSEVTAAAVSGENNSSDIKTAEGVKVTFVELGSVKCIPCKMMKPVMEKIEQTYPGQVKVLFYDVWTEAGKSAGDKFAVRVIPTQVFLDKNGKEYFRHEGFFAFEEIDKILKQKGVN